MASTKYGVFEMTTSQNDWQSDRIESLNLFETKSLDAAKAVADDSDTFAIVRDLEGMDCCTEPIGFSGTARDFRNRRTSFYKGTTPAPIVTAHTIYQNGKPLVARAKASVVITVEKAAKNQAPTVRRADYVPLPKVTEILGVDDQGEGGAICPHCGATGRWVIRFLCENGERRGAMKGCFKLFPQVSGVKGKWNLKFG